MNDAIEYGIDAIRRLLIEGRAADAEAEAHRQLESHAGNFRIEKAMSVSLMMQHKFKEALDLLRRLKKNAPEDPDLCLNLARAHLELGQYPEAEALLAPMEGLDAAALMSRSLIERNQLDAASSLIEKAAARFGSHPQLLIDRAAIAIHRGEEAAFKYLDQAEVGLAQMPETMRPVFGQMVQKNRTLAALTLEQLVDARRFAGDLEQPDADYMMARIERAEKNYTAAIKFQLSVLESQPNPEQSRFLAQLYLSAGDYLAAWPHWERRPERPGPPPGFAPPVPAWQGEALADKRVLMEIEQGHGDVIQFGRYLRLLGEQGAEICCPMFVDLQPLFEMAFPNIKFGRTPSDTNFDFYIPLLSVPAILELDSKAAVLDRSPYLSVALEETARWEQILPSGTNIGLAWKGNPENVNDGRRSILDPAPLVALITAAEANFVSLQWPEGDAEELSAYLSPDRLFDYVPLRKSFADTAGLVSALDGILTVDTSIAHLTGAMGKSCAVVQPFDPDWRWSTLGPAWYGDWLASFEQPAPGAWPAALFEAMDWLLNNIK